MYTGKLVRLRAYKSEDVHKAQLLGVKFDVNFLSKLK